MEIAKIVRLSITEVWRYEARNLTPWLCDNIEALSEAIGIDLVNPEREQSTGNFNVDIKAEDENGDMVVIENQFGTSNHDHLGKLITYGVAFEAKTAIWIVESPKQEHINAINWLNESDNGCNYYLVRLETIKIGDSHPAPLFTIISGPSVEAKELGKIKKTESERHILRLKFWTYFLHIAKEQKLSMFNSISPTKDSWIGAGAGKRGIQYVFWVTKNSIRLELRIDRGKDSELENIEIFKQLYNEKNTIENKIGDTLDWVNQEGTRMRALRKDFTNGGYKNKESEWNAISLRAIDFMKKLESATKPLVNKLTF